MKTLIRMIRANPKLAIAAASADVLLGSIAAIVVYLVLNATMAPVHILGILVLAGVFIIGIVMVAAVKAMKKAMIYVPPVESD